MEPDLVSTAVLVPPEVHGHGLSPYEAAEVLDGYLRRLAGQDARCRAVLGRLARRFLARSGHHALGFARLGDYARERLGRSGRELQTLAAVSAALDRRLYRLTGFPSAGRYLTERLGISARKARALVALERKTWDAPTLGEAYRAGTLSALQALTLVPVIAERTADAWVARAREVTLRRLGDEVEWALTVRDGLVPIAPPPARSSLAIPERQTCARPEWEWSDAELVFTAPVSVVALFRTALLAFAHAADSLPGGLEQLLLHRESRVGGPAAPPRPDLRARRLALRGAGLHGAAEPARSPPRLPLPRPGHARENRIALYAWHHLHGIHGGRVRAWGEAPAGVTWEIGLRVGRRPLVRVDAHGYATAA